MENNFWLRSLITFAVISMYLLKNISKWMNTETNDVRKIAKMANRNYVLMSAAYTFIFTFCLCGIASLSTRVGVCVCF
jgi:hypothetical protein